MTVNTSTPVHISQPILAHLIQSQYHEEVLNVIDQLRSEGISRYVDLPQLIVCGDQSSGKSSVLEAISGLDFPAKDNVCTRFATELILRRAPAFEIRISIYPDSDRPEKEQARLRKFGPGDLDWNQFSAIIKSAGEAMRIGEDDFMFSKDILRVEVSGPTQPHLTLVDLPGLYHAPDEQQDVQGISYVEDLVRSYMANPRSVMLAVISAKSELALQKVTALTREYDPEGVRTLGIITKPDTLPPGSGLEQSFLSLAQNQRVDFRLGWHVLKNRTYEERDISHAARNQSETAFFSESNWKSMSRTQTGVQSLLPKVSRVLKDHILSQMPSFIVDTQVSLKEAKALLLKLGATRTTSMELRRYLLQASQRFSNLIGNALDGIYSESFFGNALSDDGYRKRLRAVVQDRLSHFSDTIKLRGQHIQIIDDGTEFDQGRRYVYRTEFLEEVRQRMRRSRGKELPGNFNTSIIGELFYRQAQPWEDITNQCVDDLLQAVRNTTVLILEEVTDQHTVSGLLRHVINHQLMNIENTIRVKTVEILEPQKTGHPITYNPQYIEIVQEIRDQHLRDAITQRLKAFFGHNYPDDPQNLKPYQFRMQGLIDSVSSRAETDMERFACSEAIDCMEAYYKVAMRKFVDDFGNLAVEKCLLKPLAETFNLEIVSEMADEIVEDIAREDDDTVVERERLVQKIEVLQTSLNCLHRLDRYNTIASYSSPSKGEIMEHGNGDSKQEVVSPHLRSAKSTSVSAGDELEFETLSANAVAEVDDSTVSTRASGLGRKKHKNSLFFE